jgi:hypothetical protein
MGRVTVRAPLGAGGKGTMSPGAKTAVAHGVGFFNLKNEPKMGTLKRLKKAPKSPFTPKQSAKIEKSLRAGGKGGKVYQKRLAHISKVAGKGMGKQKHKPAGSPAGGQFF